MTTNSNQDQQQQQISSWTDGTSRPPWTSLPKPCCSALSGLTFVQEKMTLLSLSYESLNDPKATLCPIIEHPYFRDELRCQIN